VKVTLVTLNYNGADSTIRLLESLAAQADKDFSVVVADNGSSDVQKLRGYKGLPFHLMENGANLGFAGGNNPALEYAFQNGADWALLINNDTWVESDFIVRLKANLEHRQGLVGLPLKETNAIAYAGRIDWLKPTLEHVYELPHQNESDLFYPIGGGMAISRKAYETIGGLEQDYFLYFEDVDYAIKARNAAVPVEFMGGPVINHQVSGTTRALGSPLLLRYHYRNALYFNFKNAPLFTKVITIPWSVIIILKQLLKIGNQNHVAESKAILNGIIDFYQEQMGHISTKTKVGIECESIEGKNPQWGIGKIIMRLLEELSKRPELANDFEFTLYFKDHIPDFPFLQSPLFTKKTVPVPGKPNRLFPFYYYLLLPIRLWLDRNDVMFWPNYMLPIIALGKSHVLLTEDVYYEGHEGSLPFRYRLAYRIFGGWTACHATKILAISDTSKNNIARLYNINPERLIVNHLGVDPINVSDKKEGEYVLYVGQAFPRRHLRETMQAFQKIAPEFPNLRLNIIGTDKYPNPMLVPLMKQINAELGREAVTHKDYIEQKELESYYAGAKILAYVSDREAFGLPPMEALSLGVPSLIADNALGHELFGDNAIYVSDTNSADSIAQALREAMTNSELREKIKEHGPEVAGRYTWKAFTDKFLEIIKSIAHHA
jgi:hypothetical protein